MSRVLILTAVTAVYGIWAGAAFATSGAGLSVGADEVFGPDPKLEAPKTSLVPKVNVAKAVGWAGGQKPTVPAGLDVSQYASGLDHPRWLYQLPNGDVLVAESNKPPQQATGIKGWIMGLVMARAGAGVDSANRITRLADTDGDGKVDETSTFLSNLYSPFGMALIGDDFYVANADAIIRFKYQSGAKTISGQGVEVVKLPGGPRNHHWTKNILASPDGKRLYVTVGSNSNVGENGMDEELQRATVLEVSLADGKTRTFASGLRNPNGLAYKPGTDELWTVVNERDELGDNIVPDYLTSVKDGAFYGWPYSYFGQNIDTRITPNNAQLVAKAVKPDYALGAHTASLGLAFSNDKTLGPAFASGAFIGQHGSWNRTAPAGYRVIFVPFSEGRPAGQPVVVLGGFLDADGQARGRPVGVIADQRGGVLVADDVGNKIWRVSAGKATADAGR
ncbi:MAG: sorbosone dehydrogenase family protein [Hyphomicrobium sp.]